MTESIALAVTAMLRWLATSPTSALLLTVCIQVALIALAARVAADQLARWNAAWSHRIWLSAVTLVLTILPLHAIFGGWQIQVSPSIVASLPESPSEVVRLRATNAMGDGERAANTASTQRHATPENSSRQDSARPLPHGTELAGEMRPGDEPIGARQPSHLSPLTASSEAAAVPSSSPLVKASFFRNALLIATGVYLLGCLVILTRLLIGATRLARWSRAGRKLGSDSRSAALQAARDVGLRNPPRVRAADQVGVPLVYGLFRPVVLVPGDFDRWSAEEQRAALLHELMHIRRRDMIGQWMAQAARTIYWFHPASWYLDRRLTEARERATDQQVIAGGMEAGRYAASLLNIVARGGAAMNGRSLHSASAVAMSAVSEIEARLREILQPALTRRSGLRIAGPCSIAMLVLLTVLTTVRMERVVAHDDPPKATPKADSGAEFPEAAANDTAPKVAKEQPAPLAASENDLYDRIRDCEVLDVSGDDFHAIFTVSGQVLSPDSQPVEGAIVLLRESSTIRISSEGRKYLGKDRHLLRTQDVFARTTTDREGRFEFKEVKSPALPRRSNTWRGDVVAAHKDLGVGWLSLGDKQQKRRVDSGLTLVLRPTTSISGRFVSPETAPIEGATVGLNVLVKPGESWMGTESLDLQMSQLTPRTQTDADGTFLFTGLPEGWVATVSMSHPAWLGGGAAIATSDDVPLGRQQNGSSYLSDHEVLASPAEVTADPGISVSGRVVDPEGRPVPDIAVAFASSLTEETTDQQGEFRLLIPTSWVDRDRNTAAGTSKLVARGSMEAGFLLRYQDVPATEIAAGQPVTIQLERGALVRGRVVTDEGEPVVGAVLYPLSDALLMGGTTDEDGDYELLLPQTQHTIGVATDLPGYALPSRSELIAAARNGDNAAGWPQVRVDLSDGVAEDLPPIVVSRTKPVQVIASLPDGRPAIGATAVIKDQIQLSVAGREGYVPPPRIVEKSGAVMTNQLGRADLLPQGVPTDSAYIDVKLATADQAYGATVPLNQAVDGMVSVVLTSDWLIEGRVLIDGRPIAGAKVSIGQSTPSLRTRNGQRAGAFSTSNFQYVFTDTEGWYRASVPQGNEYSVRVQSLPGEEVRPAIGYRPTLSGDGRLQVRDFAFYRGNQDISGRIVDLQGNAVAGARAQVLPTSNAQSAFWIGHQEESQFETDDQGRFHLKNVPAGTYRLSISAPRTDTPTRAVPTMVVADAGQTDLEVVLNPQPQPDIPRLQPRRIESVQPGPSQP